MRRSSLACLLVSFACALGAGATARSQPPPALASDADSAKADALFHEGNAFYKQTKYAEAKERFEAALRLKKAHDIAANLGYSEMKLGLDRDAAEHLAFAVKTWPPTGKADKRRYAEDRFQETKQKVETLTIKVNVAGAQVLVDGKVVGVAPLEGPVFVDVGSRTVEARHEGYQDAKQTVPAKKGGEDTVTLALAQLAPPSATVTPSASAVPLATAAPSTSAVVPPPPPPTSPPDYGARNTVVVGGLALGGLGLAAGIAGAVVSSSKSSDAASKLGALTQAGGPNACANPAAQAQCNALDSSYRGSSSAKNVAIVGFVGAGVGVGGALLAYWLWPAKAGQEGARVAPVVSAGGGGVAVTGEF
jgi:hypothetical protein